MDEETIFLTLEEKLENAAASAAHEFGSVHTGKANPAMVENIQAEAYGSRMAIKELAAISTPDPRAIAIQPWDKSNLKPIEKALQTSNLGINPVVMGDVVRLPMPELTGERRQELAKLAAKHAEDARVSARAARREAMEALKKLQKDGEMSEDEAKRLEKEVQKATDETIEKINRMLEAKEKELLTV